MTTSQRLQHPLQAPFKKSIFSACWPTLRSNSAIRPSDQRCLPFRGNALPGPLRNSRRQRCSTFAFTSNTRAASVINTLHEAHPGRVMTPAQLEALGLLAPHEPKNATTLAFTSRSGTRGTGGAGPATNERFPERPRNETARGPDRQCGGLLVVLSGPPAQPYD